MRTLDWIVLVGSLVFIVVYGVWKGRRNRDLDEYILSNRDMRWYTVAFSIMATQASAITFLSTPGQAYTDGMRFLQFYFGLPLAMIVLAVTAVPIYRRLKVYTAYEYLESRFDQKTRTLAAGLFLIQRGLACGLTIYAPAVILSVLLGWNIHITNWVIGLLVISYTVSGGTRAVNHTNFHQMIIIMAGMFAAGFVLLRLLPAGVSLGEATFVAGKLGRLNAIDLEFDVTNRYNIWSGLIGGFFLALSYFGTDQSQVGRYLSGQSVTQSRLGLLFNGMVKVPMQFIILFIGALVFVFYQFTPPPVFFNSVETRSVAAGPHAGEFRAVEEEYRLAAEERSREALNLVEARRSGNPAALAAAETSLEAAHARTREIRADAVEIIRKNNPKADGSDTNYVFLTFVLGYLPAGLVGLILAAVFAASMSSTASELNALGSTTIVDVYKRMLKPEASDSHYVLVSKVATFFWGGFAILFAEYAGRLGSLVEAVNILGSLFYGTILGIFLLAFYFKKVGGTATFIAALAGEAVVVACYFGTKISFLWFNVIGCLVVILVALALTPFFRKPAGLPRPV